MDRAKFYRIVREHLFRGKITSSQVKGIEAVLDEWDNKEELVDPRWLAYMLATIYHETAKTMQPIEEFGKGKGRPYGNKVKHSGVKYIIPDQIFYGRGLVQLTWYENYELMSRLLYNDFRLVLKPSLLLDAKVSINVLFEGMTKGSSSFGDFTGKCLEMYFNSEKNDPINARKIINGLDKANFIASYYEIFLKAIIS